MNLTIPPAPLHRIATIVLLSCYLVFTPFAHAAVAANNLILTQRNSANDNNVTVFVPAVSGALVGFNSSLAPVTYSLGTGVATALAANTNATGGLLTYAGTLASKGITNGAALDSFGAAQSGTAQNVSTSASPTFAGGTFTGTTTIAGTNRHTRIRNDAAIIDFTNAAENAFINASIQASILTLLDGSGTGFVLTSGSGALAGNLTVSGTGPHTFAGAIVSLGANTGHAANRAMLSFEGASRTFIKAYGADASTQGTVSLQGVSSDASVSTIYGLFDTTGLSLAGNLTVSGTGGQVIGGAASTVRMPGYGVGTATFDSSGNITSVSDERMKDIIGPFKTGLASLRKLSPQFYHWNAKSGLNTDDLNVSLMAQDLIAAGVPEAVFTYRTIDVTEEVVLNGKVTGTRPKIGDDGKVMTQKVEGTYTVNDRTVIAVLVNAIKELDARVTALEAK